MKPERINQVIAEHCGVERGIDNQWRVDGIWYSRPPDYCNDLNAMREARKTLRQIEQHRFVKHLRSTLHLIDGEITLDYVFSAIDAPANQQAEAFVKAINKWEEE